ncbi:MAG: 30S ribosomal protein S9 [Minisyncoccia bacterium]|jgi:small subunit ribosomal protein S9
MPSEKETKHTPVHTAPRAHRVPAAAARTAVLHSAHAAAAEVHRPRPTRAAPEGRYSEAIGRRKTAVARVRIMAGKGKVTVNGKEPTQYFVLPRLLAIALAPLRELKLDDIDVSVKIGGGGISAQAEAVRHGISRAIVVRTSEWKPRLRALGYLTRDSRMVERKKYGLKKARRAPQWAKR